MTQHVLHFFSEQVAKASPLTSRGTSVVVEAVEAVAVLVAVVLVGGGFERNDNSPYRFAYSVSVDA